jgi:hypothetical protein
MVEGRGEIVETLEKLGSSKEQCSRGEAHA